MVRTLIQAKVDLNKKDYEGLTPLYLAAILNHMDIAKELIVDYMPKETVMFGFAKLWWEMMGAEPLAEPIQQKEFEDENQLNHLEEIENQLHENGFVGTSKLGPSSFGNIWKGSLQGQVVAIKTLQNMSTDKIFGIIEELSMLE